MRKYKITIEFEVRPTPMTNAEQAANICFGEVKDYLQHKSLCTELSQAQITMQRSDKRHAMYARLIDGDCLVAAAPIGIVSESKKDGSFWDDYYHTDADPARYSTVMLEDVPRDLMHMLASHGTDMQFFPDGYKAWDVAKRYTANRCPRCGEWTRPKLVGRSRHCRHCYVDLATAAAESEREETKDNV